MQRITLFERQIIEVGLRTNKSVRAIARSLGRDHRVIQKEVKRNGGTYLPYTAAKAQELAESRQQSRTLKKLEKPKFLNLKKHVERQLKKDYSPEQIAGETKEQPPENLAGATIAHETIYQYIYTGEGKYLWPHLRKARKKRQVRHGRKPKKIRIPERISIHERPAYITAKTSLGHWESDTLEGKRETGHHLSVQYERKSQLVRLTLINGKSASETNRAISSKIGAEPKLWKSITYDNGSETTGHTQLRKKYKVKTFHCDPYSAWQKGGVENINGLVRQYVPKGSDISCYPPAEIYAIQEKLNNRPRKSLNYLTPNQYVAREVGQ